ncbi:MAG: hypothetical protein H7X70_05535 [Candidatus Kapabacteria bacterium]|nr:hypothetical protein [Candidatus Kapabacteria bacterium]
MRVLLAIISLCLLPLAAVAQHSPMAIDAIDSMVTSLADTLVAREGGTSFSFSISPHPDADWIAGIISRRVLLLGGTVHKTNESEHPGIHIAISDVSTRYNIVESTDSIVRTIIVRLDAYKGSSSQSGFVALPTLRRQDVITRSEALVGDSRQHTGSHGDVPLVPSSFWDDIAQPVVFIAAAATTVLLLFTVRSQ